MNIFENGSSLRNNLKNNNQINSKKTLLFKLKLIHKIFNTINISLLSLIFIFSFMSFNSQRKWTSLYKNLSKTRSNNNNLIDYISKTEEFYIKEIESLNTLNKTTPKDLIYINKQISKKKKNNFFKNLKYIKDGLNDSKYQRGF